MLCVCLFVFSTIHLLFFSDAKGEDIPYIVINNYSFIYFPILFFTLPLDHRHIISLRWLFLGIWAIICTEVLLYSVGLSVFGPDLTEEMATDYAGVYRVHTTLGAATGTSIVVYILGILLTSYFPFDRRIVFLILIITTIAVLFSISRGAILVWGLYVLSLFYRDYLKKSNFIRKIGYLVLAIASLVLLYHYSFFDPLIARSELKNRSNWTSGRDEFNERVFDIIKEADFMGVGSGEVYPDKSIIDVITIKHYAPVHNVYLLYLAEIGLFGCLFLLFIFVFALRGLDYSKTYSWLLWGILLISCNTEMVFAWAEFMPLLLLYILCCKKQQGYCTTRAPF